MIRYPDGVPHWFTRMVHRWRVRRCRRNGHTGRAVTGGCCIRCGHIWFTADD